MMSLLIGDFLMGINHKEIIRLEMFYGQIISCILIALTNLYFISFATKWVLMYIFVR
jgi:hypothetical protein